jgi:hypothetical protein
VESHVVKITVLMAVYETPLRWLREAVDSVLGQTYRYFEFLIVDDGNCDSALIEYLGSVEASDSRVRVLHEPQRGLTRSLNRGLDQARGDWIARQDADDWSAPHRLEMQVRFLEANREVCLCGSNAWTHQASGRPLWPTDLPRGHAEILGVFPARNPFIHGAAIFSRRRALALGGYCESFPCAQDYDFFWRLAETGPVANLAEPLYHYRYTPGSISASRATDQAVAYTAARKLAHARAREGGPGSSEIQTALAASRREVHETMRGILGSQLKAADHLLLAGEYGQALRAYLLLIAGHPASALAWAKLARYGLFLALPPAREASFR